MTSTLLTRDGFVFPSDPAPTVLMEMYPISPRVKYIANPISSLVTVDNLSDQAARVYKRKFSFGTTASHAFDFSLDVTQLALHLALQTEELFIPQNKGFT